MMPTWPMRLSLSSWLFMTGSWMRRTPASRRHAPHEALRFHVELQQLALQRTVVEGVDLAGAQADLLGEVAVVGDDAGLPVQALAAQPGAQGRIERAQRRGVTE